MMRFENKIFLVSGGDSGIGKACSQRLASEDGYVIVIARNMKQEIKPLLKLS